MNQPLRPLQCPTCGGANVTPATQLKEQSKETGLHVVFESGEETWASRGHAGFPVKRGRVCLDCGYVMVFMSDRALGELRAKIAGLRPLAPTDQE